MFRLRIIGNTFTLILAVTLLVFALHIYFINTASHNERGLSYLDSLGEYRRSYKGEFSSTERKQRWQTNPIRRAPINTQTESCTPKEKVVFLKTHKTASSTVASILERYGYTRNLTFAVSNAGLEFAHTPHFTSNPVRGWKKEDGYDMLTNHVRFNKSEMNAVVHNATYVTILRQPVSQLVSVFGKFELDRENQIEEFMKDPERFFGLVRSGYWKFAKNAQLYDLGLDHVYHDDPAVLASTINKLNNDFDLVLLTEYLDESLVLLRRLLCWNMSDILYISNTIRNAERRVEIDEDLRQKILAWNKADLQLYQYASLWKRIRDYGPQFQQDLEEFRTQLRELFEECIDPLKRNMGDKREEKYVLKSDAPPRCKGILWGDVEYTRRIQQRMWDRGIYILLPNHRARN